MSGRIRVAKSVQSTSFSLRHQDVKKKWVVVDADGAILGRLAASIATMLRGRFVTRDGKLVGDKGYGRYLSRGKPLEASPTSTLM